MQQQNTFIFVPDSAGVRDRASRSRPIHQDIIVAIVRDRAGNGGITAILGANA